MPRSRRARAREPTSEDELEAMAEQINHFRNAAEHLEGVMTEEFVKHPERAGAALRRVHGLRRDLTKRYDFIDRLESWADFMSNSEELWEGAFDGGLPQALLQVALDRQIYTGMFVDEKATDYVLGVYACLSKAVAHAVVGTCDRLHKAGGGARWAGEVMQNFPRLWSLLVQLRQLVTFGCTDDGMVLLPDSTIGKQANKFRDLICDLLISHIYICDAEEGRKPSMYRGDIGHVALLALACGSYIPHTRPRLISIFREVTLTRSQTDLDAFLDRAIACQTLIPSRFIRSMSDLLYDEELLDSELYRALVSLMTLLQYKPLETARGANTQFPLDLMCAAQRQVCSGESEQKTWEILQYTFVHITMILARDSGTRARRFNRAFSHYLILLAAHSLCFAAQDTTDDQGECLGGIMGILTSDADIMDDASFPRALNASFRASVHQVWHRAHARLAALPAARAPHQAKVARWWRDFGAKCGVDVDAPYVAEAPAGAGAADAAGWTKDRGCAWRECLCFGERPHHKLRKCKRCERVLYCSKRCQTQDWSEGGHKWVCRQSSP
ncbi:zinc finger MYND domain-containing protein [Phanerochaete sordida]|uniref:Zinc finger MYND domain-containing protein n=1 Tax=Phanerochaete sordida TaxID=48140 RepID=A0A9P3GGQ2_9APHY|nr:zinc finger MYND domain-containing protein [Phanerochaete sordida]